MTKVMSKLQAFFCMALILAVASCGGPSRDTVKSEAAKGPAAVATALKSLQAKAAAGDAEAQNELGGDYRDGAGVAQDWGMDYFWNSLAANSSDEVSDSAMVSRNVAASHLTPVQIEILDAKVKAWKAVPLPVVVPKPEQGKPAAPAAAQTYNR